MKHEHEVRAKKFLGQHFLTDEKTAVAIVDALPQSDNKMVTLEIGPGMGVLTKYLLQRNDIETWAIELDRHAPVHYCKIYAEQPICRDVLELV